MFHKVRISLGEGYLDRYTIFEFKRFSSLYVHCFNTIAQDRFHSHAFWGLAFVLYGGYYEEWKNSTGTYCKWIGPGIRWIPREYNHRLLKSKPNTISVLITGPWAKFWTEEKDGIVRTLGWGRKVVKIQDASNG